MKTKDGVDYTEGMTLYRVFLRTDHYEIVKVENTWQHVPTWFGGPGGHAGCIGDAFALYVAAVEQVITHLNDELADKASHINGQIDGWQEKLRERLT